jgi:hypothetical protein
MDQRPRNSDMAKDDYIDRYQDSRGSGITAIILGFAALLIAGWLLLSTRVDDGRTTTAENTSSATAPASRAPAAARTHQRTTNPRHCWLQPGRPRFGGVLLSPLPLPPSTISAGRACAAPGTVRASHLPTEVSPWSPPNWGSTD